MSIKNLQTSSALAVDSINKYATGGNIAIGGVTFRNGAATVTTGPKFASETSTGLVATGLNACAFSCGGNSRLTLTNTNLGFHSSIPTTTIRGTTQSYSTDTGTLVLKGGLGIAHNLAITGTFSAPGLSTSTSLTTTNDPAHPVFSFLSDIGTGFYYAASSSLGLSCAGALKLTVANSSATVASGVDVVVGTTLTLSGGLGVAKNLSCTVLKVPTAYTVPGLDTTKFLAAADGSASAPAYAFDTARSTGLYRDTATGDMCLSAAGSIVARFSSSYRVNIGAGSTGEGFAAGENASASNTGIAIGAAAQASTDSVAIGYQAYASWNAVTIGPTCYADTAGVCLGSGTTCSANGIAVGWNTQDQGGYTCQFQDIYCELGRDSWYTYCDERLKTDIADLGVGMDLVRRLRPISYKWALDDKANAPVDDKRHVGFSYQRVKTAAEELGLKDFSGVTVNNDTGAVCMGAFLPFIVQALVELHTRFRAIGKPVANNNLSSVSV